MAQDLPSMQLTQEDARKIVYELEDALKAHRCWLERFQTMLVCRTTPRTWDLSKDSHLLGEFGRWYYKRANSYLKNHPSFTRVGKNHYKMHRQARKLARMALKRRPITPADYTKFTRAVDAFKLSLRIMFTQPREMLHHTDTLTGAASRYGMQPHLEQEQERIRRTGDVSCIALADLDLFKVVNDTYGHQAGDVVLQEWVNFLREHMRRYDQLYRYGGEEFLLLLPGAWPEQVRRIVDRLRRGLAKHPVTVGPGKTVMVTGSFGIAVLDPEESVQTCIERADRAMYAAKRAGRNRTRVWQD